jgi:hypothetical protein
MTKNKDDDYIVVFKGAKLNKKEANRVGLGIIFGIIGIIVGLIVLGPDRKYLILFTAFCLSLFGYVYLGRKWFK